MNKFAVWQAGTPNPYIVCPFCTAQGYCRTKTIDVKQGISGAKATGAILTGGVSLFATGLSRKPVKQTQITCCYCTTAWMA